MLCLFGTLGQVVGLAGVAAADSLVPIGDGQLADSSNIIIRVNEIMK